MLLAVHVINRFTLYFNHKEEKSGLVFITLTILVLTLITAQASSATGFNESFQNWLLIGQSDAVDQLESKITDPSSRECLRCHNGKNASMIVLKNAGEPMQFGGAMNTNHPIGMDYVIAAGRKPHAYKPRASLKQSIHLENGKVTCISCHSLKKDSQAQQKGFIKVRQINHQTGTDCTASRKLTIGPRVTDLCLACHNM